MKEVDGQMERDLLEIWMAGSILIKGHKVQRMLPMSFSQFPQKYMVFKSDILIVGGELGMECLDQNEFRHL